MFDFIEVGERLSNWGRWGADDERGTLNFLTPEVVARARESIRSGKTFELSLPLGSDSPQVVTGPGGRFNPIHTMTLMPGDAHLLVPENPHEVVIADDALFFPLQVATQWDGFAHFGYGGYFYNNRAVHETVTAVGGASSVAIDATMPGMVGRGVLLDIAALRGVDWLEPTDDPITPEELERAEAAQSVRLRTGDALLVRTGWRKKALVEGWSPEWLQANPGLAPECAELIHDRELAAVASDNWCVEVYGPRAEGLLPLHAVLIRDMGVSVGEMFDLEELAADCREDGQWDFFLSAPPLRVQRAVGSPTSPIAVK